MKIIVSKVNKYTGVDRKVSVRTSNGYGEIPIGTAFVHKLSGWNGGGQTWHFKPTDMRLKINPSPTLTKMKQALLEEVEAIAAKTPYGDPLFAIEGEEEE